MYLVREIFNNPGRFVANSPGPKDLLIFRDLAREGTIYIIKSHSNRPNRLPVVWSAPLGYPSTIEIYQVVSQLTQTLGRVWPNWSVVRQI